MAIDADDQSMYLLLPVVLLGQASEFPDVEKSARDLWLQIAPRLGSNRRFCILIDFQFSLLVSFLKLLFFFFICRAVKVFQLFDTRIAERGRELEQRDPYADSSAFVATASRVA